MKPETFFDFCWWLITALVLFCAWQQFRPLHSSLPCLDQQKPSVEVVGKAEFRKEMK